METSRDRHIKQIVESGKRKVTSTTKRPTAAAPSAARRSVRPTAPIQNTRTETRRGTASRPEESVKPTKRILRPKPGAPKTERATKQIKSELPTKDTDSDTSTNASIWIAILLLFISGLLMLSCLSYLKYWRVDQSIATLGNIFSDTDQMAYNSAGRIGAVISDILIRKWFGIFALLTPLIPLFAAIKIFRYGKRTLYRSLRFTAITIFMGSLTLGHFAGANPDVLGSGYGGDLGINAAQWFQNIIGDQGTSLFLVLLTVAVTYYVNAGWFAVQYILTKRVLEQNAP